MIFSTFIILYHPAHALACLQKQRGSIHKHQITQKLAYADAGYGDDKVGLHQSEQYCYRASEYRQKGEESLSRSSCFT